MHDSFEDGRCGTYDATTLGILSPEALADKEILIYYAQDRGLDSLWTKEAADRFCHQ